MKNMTVQELYDKLCSEKFQDPSNGDLFYNFFVYQYPADKEYEMREQIAEIKKNILRPSIYVDLLCLDIFEEFCTYLDNKPFGKKYPSRLAYLCEKERDSQMDKKVAESLVAEANGDAFLKYIHSRIMEHVSTVDKLKRPYVFLYGMGNIFPYLRASNLLNRYESLNDSGKYKIILFYPGEKESNTFKLFGKLQDNHTYRAIVLINE